MKKLLLLVLLFIGISLNSSVVFGQQVVTTVDSSSPNACDGSAVITDSTIYENSISWQGNGTVYQTGGYFIDSLCPGTYVVTYTNFLGTYSYTFIIGSGTTDPCAGFYTSLTYINSSDSVTCDGSVILQIYGGTAPYSYMWNNGTTTQNQTNLCPGIYYCTVVDANGCNSTVTCSIGAYNSANDTMIIINNGGYPDSTVVDTLGNNWIEDCVMDFLSIDSAYISNYGYNSLDSIWVTWTLVDTNGLVVIQLTSTYGVPSNTTGVYTTFLTIFCPQKNTDYHYLQASDQVYLNPSQMGIEENESVDLVITNPFDNTINIILEKASDFEIELVDLNGSIVYSGQGNNESAWTINTAELNAGSYFLRFNDGTSTVVRKLIK